MQTPPYSMTNILNIIWGFKGHTTNLEGIDASLEPSARAKRSNVNIAVIAKFAHLTDLFGSSRPDDNVRWVRSEEVLGKVG